jgi:hypothetical protein
MLELSSVMSVLGGGQINHQAKRTEGWARRSVKDICITTGSAFADLFWAHEYIGSRTCYERCVIQVKQQQSSVSSKESLSQKMSKIRCHLSSKLLEA